MEARVKYGAFLLSYTHAPRPQYGICSSPNVTAMPITLAQQCLSPPGQLGPVIDTMETSMENSKGMYSSPVRGSMPHVTALQQQQLQQRPHSSASDTQCGRQIFWACLLHDFCLFSKETRRRADSAGNALSWALGCKIFTLVPPCIVFHQGNRVGGCLAGFSFSLDPLSLAFRIEQLLRSAACLVLPGHPPFEGWLVSALTEIRTFRAGTFACSGRTLAVPSNTARTSRTRFAVLTECYLLQCSDAKR